MKQINIDCHTYKDKSLYILGLLVFSVLVFLFAPLHKVTAEEAYGWLAITAEHVGLVDSSCSPDNASTEISLVNPKSKVSISSPVPSWTVSVVNSSGGNVETKTFSGVTSSPICFDPVSQGVRVTVAGNTAYHVFSGPAVYPEPASASGLKGQHFKGFVEVKPKSLSTSDIESYTATDKFLPNSASFVAKLNDTDTLYGNSGTKLVKFYFANGSTVVKKIVNLGNPFASTVPYPPSGDAGLADGQYLWSFHAELNNSVTSGAWTFSGIPASSVPPASSVIIDGTAPISEIKNLRIRGINSTDPNKVDVSFDYTIDDAYSGIQAYSISYTTDDVNFNSVVDVLSVPPNTANINLSNQVNNLSKGLDYKFYITGVDNLGNSHRYGPFTISVPLTLEKPVISWSTPPLKNNSFDTTKREAWAIWDNSDNPLGIKTAYICWSTDSSSLNSLVDLTLFDTTNDGVIENTVVGSVRCDVEGGTILSVLNSTNNAFFRNTSSLPTGTVYFKMFAYNPAGWGATDVISTSIDNVLTDALNSGRVDIELIAPTGENIGVDYLRPTIKLNSTHNRDITLYGICYFTSLSDRNSFIPTLSNTTGTNCKQNPQDIYNQSWSTSISLPWPVLTHFDSLALGTNYYFRAFLINDLANMTSPATRALTSSEHDFADGEYATINPNYHFEHYGDINDADPTNDGNTSLKLLYKDDTTFDSTNSTYGDVWVSLIGLDKTYNLANINHHIYSSINGTITNREVSYTAKLYYGTDAFGNLMFRETKTGTISTLRVGQGLDSSFKKEVHFSNVPVGQYKIEISLNDPESVYPCSATDTDCPSDKLRVLTGTLLSPGQFPSDQTAANSGSASAPIDPNLTLEANPTLIRRGQTSTITWSMDDHALNTFSCRIYGSLESSAPTGAFDPKSEGALNPFINRISELYNTKPLNSTQEFEIVCTDGAGNTYSDPARVEVIGELQET